MATYNELYLDIRKALQQAGYPGAGLEARELVCCGSGKTKAELIRDGQAGVPAEIEGTIRALADRHLSGEPVAYLLGEWDFYGLTLYVTEDVLIPRVDTEVLAGEAIRYVRTLGPCRVLDLCAGSGCVGLAVAANAPDCTVLLGDLSPGAVQVCRRNIQRCGLSGRVSVTALDALQPPPAAAGKFACIVCNPPYIPREEIAGLEHSVRDFEPHLALCGGEDGLDFYRAVSHHWRAALSAHGRIYFEAGMGQAGAIRQIMQAEGFSSLQATPDTQQISRVVYGTMEI